MPDRAVVTPKQWLRVAILVVLVAAAGVARAADTGWTGSVNEEDDFWAPDNRDRHYSHGIRLGATSGDVQDPYWQEPFHWLPLFPQAGEIVRRYELMLGQNMYTPENTALVNPDPRDRPYAGWLYAGVGLMQDTDTRQFDRYVLRLGTVGPSSLAGELQTKWHVMIAVARPRGWHAQLHDEPTLDLYRERKWRIYTPLESSGLGWDVLPQASLRVGNVYDYAATGAMIRFGRNLLVDYGPAHIDENLGASYINPSNGDGGWGWYVFLGTEGRFVARNMFLDGNSFQRSPSVSKEVAVGDAEIGVAVTSGHFRASYTYVYRSNEFVTQDHPDHYGVFNVSFRMPF